MRQIFFKLQATGYKLYSYCLSCTHEPTDAVCVESVESIDEVYLSIVTVIARLITIKARKPKVKRKNELVMCAL